MRVLQKPAVARVRADDLTQRVGVERIVARGVDLADLIDRLLGAAASELVAYFAYLGLRAQLTGSDTQQAACEEARLNNRAHFELIAPRIYELGGAIPTDVGDFTLGEQVAWAGPLSEQNGAGTTAAAVLQALLGHERSGIQAWSDVADLTFGTDTRTYALVARILDDKVQHEARFIELLSKERDGVSRPSGHVPSQPVRDGV
jgi:ferritin-like protein